MLGYTISCVVLSLIILAFIPAMIASHKSYSFVRWYLYGLLLFPVALIHSVMLNKPVRIVTVYSTGKDGNRKKRIYRTLPVKKNERRFSLWYVANVFLSKLIFGAFAAFIAFAVIRIYVADTVILRGTCVLFAVVFSVAMMITEIFGFSRVPIFADEMTKRALVILLFSAIISVVMSGVKVLITSNIDSHREFFRFLCTVVSFIGFLLMLLNMQRYYYSMFSRFFDYCLLTVGSYGMYASVMLVMLSVLQKWRFAIYALSMPMQMFNFSYFADINYFENLPMMYSAALVHIFVVVLILLSGLGCYNYKKKELAYRVEYRSKAFRMSRRQALRRHIPKAGMQTVKPVK